MAGAFAADGHRNHVGNTLEGTNIAGKNDVGPGKASHQAGRIAAAVHALAREQPDDDRRRGKFRNRPHSAGQLWPKR